MVHRVTKLTIKALTRVLASLAIGACMGAHIGPVSAQQCTMAEAASEPQVSEGSQDETASLGAASRRLQEMLEGLGDFVNWGHDRLERTKGDPYLRAMASKYQSLYPMGYGGRPSAEPSRPPAELNSDAANCSGGVSNPVYKNQAILATGEHLRDEADFPALNSYGFNLTRTYRSKTGAGFIFGTRWPSNIDPMKVNNYGGCRLTDSGCYPYFIRLFEPGCAQYTYALDANAEIYTVNNSVAMGYMYWNSVQQTYSLFRDKL